MKSYQEAKASHDVLEEVMKLTPAPIVENPTPVQIIKHISLKEVSFAYEGGKQILEDINIEMNSGQTLAFVGPSGSGKSTLLKLLVGLYQPNA